MKLFGTLEANDYTVEQFSTDSPMSWELVSSSAGLVITTPEYLDGAVTIQRASNDPDEFFRYDITPKINEDSGIYEYVLYRSIRHLFYERGIFYSGSNVITSKKFYLSGSRIVTASQVTPPDECYVVSIGQNFIGDKIKPKTFELTLDSFPVGVKDDGYGNLYVSQSGTGKYVGNIFYRNGVAVIARDTSSIFKTIGLNGIKITEDDEVYIDYTAQTSLTRHEANVRLYPTEFNFSPFNPSILSKYSGSNDLTIEFGPLEYIPSSSQSSSYWNLYNMMGSGVIKPYVTTIGLYNDKYELLAVAKTVTPIQRTFDVEQIFIVRFDTNLINY